jgi:hypothetical protein
MLKTKILSPLNVSVPLQAPFFSELEVKQLFDQFVQERRKSAPGFALDASIQALVLQISNGAVNVAASFAHLHSGHQGLVSMCGVRVEQLTVGAPTLEQWRNALYAVPIRSEFADSLTGQHLCDLLLELQGRQGAQYLLDQPSLPVMVPKSFANYLVVAGLLRRWMDWALKDVRPLTSCPCQPRVSTWSPSSNLRYRTCWARQREWRTSWTAAGRLCWARARPPMHTSFSVCSTRCCEITLCCTCSTNDHQRRRASTASTLP